MREPTAEGSERHGLPQTVRQQSLFAVGMAALVLAVIGPFGTFQDLSFFGRLVYWGMCLLGGTLVVRLLLYTLLPRLLDGGRSLGASLAILLVTANAGVSGIVGALEWVIRGHRPDGVTTALLLYLYCLIITGLVSAVPVGLHLRAIGRFGGVFSIPASGARIEPVPPVADAPTPPPTVRFLRRVPVRLGGQLLALQMEDHYVRVHTMLGSDLVLMRLKDAVAELEGLDGLQVHRSHWVAAAAVRGTEQRGDGTYTLVLLNGLRVPVSRTFAAAVRARGWPKLPPSRC